jgi:hypothetical protein
VTVPESDGRRRRHLSLLILITVSDWRHAMITGIMMMVDHRRDRPPKVSSQLGFATPAAAPALAQDWSTD